MIKNIKIKKKKSLKLLYENCNYGLGIWFRVCVSSVSPLFYSLFKL